jgi:ribosomal protein S18 acetylase RimI-like enzyme
MTPHEVVTAAGIRLVPASVADRSAIIALQRAAYAANRAILGVEPLPLQADYDAIFAGHETWVIRREQEGTIAAVLFIEVRADDVLIWSVATDPAYQGSGFGRTLLETAEIRARQLGRDCVRLYTGEKLTERVAWYERSGYVIERREVLADRAAVHMVKALDGTDAARSAVGEAQG